MNVRGSALLVFLLAIAGCMKPNPLIYTLGQDSGDGDGDPSSAEMGDGDGDSGEAEAAPMDLADGEACEPFEAPFETGCGECLVQGCCELAVACAEVDACLCLAACLLEGGSKNECRSECDDVKPKDLAELDPLLECAAASCEQEC